MFESTDSILQDSDKYIQLIRDTFDIDDHQFKIESILEDIEDFSTDITFKIKATKIVMTYERIRKRTIEMSIPEVGEDVSVRTLDEMKGFINNKVQYIKSAKLDFNVNFSFTIKEIIDNDVMTRFDQLRKLGYNINTSNQYYYDTFTSNKDIVLMGDFNNLLKLLDDKVLSIINQWHHYKNSDQFKDINPTKEDIYNKINFRTAISISFNGYNPDDFKSIIDLKDIPDNIIKDFKEFVKKHGITMTAQEELKEIIKKVK